MSGARLQLTGVRWSTAGTTILDGIDLTAPSGALTGLIGPNGAGKSTVLRVVAGALAPDQGTVALGGLDLATVPRRDRARRVALVEQDAAAAVPLTVADAVLVGRTPHGSRWGGTTDHDRAVVAAAMAEAGVTGFAARTLATLSGGEQQRVHLARALAQEPGLMLLDEPTNHLDVRARLDVLDVVHRLTGRGVTVVAALHDLNVAASACEHVVLLDAGRVVAAGPVSEVLRPEVLEPVYRVRCTVLPHPGTGRPVLTFS